ncbi:hypothetical protein CAC42_3970 [Sphaceloma murrayae]|uniref:FAS1 domain-containing protein n=1 Tax=Sphaceloma murrayae TaxID=2082308 RepID=A0A2K1QSJ0_9PEZI|nr:hypothetical protein CAC42_3970 [Sphaceloma murrayae]
MKTVLLLVATLSMTQAFTPPKPILRRPFVAGPYDTVPQEPMADEGVTTKTTQILSDILGLSKQINIFASFTRDIASVSARLDTHDLNTTVLAPANGAITSLPRKPWEDPKEYEQLGTNAYSGKDGEDRAHANLRRFVEAHVVPQSPWEKGVKVQSLGGGTVWWEEDNQGVRRIMPSGAEVKDVGSSVGNGAVWILKDVVNYA